MRLLVDNKIPFFKEYLHKIKNYKELSIEYFTDSELTNNDCIDADALFIRSTTKIDTELLSNSCIKFIGSATSGYDHIEPSIFDCSKYEIFVASGCNASAVVNWVLSCISLLFFKKLISSSETIGIVGYGNVGKLLSNILNNLQIKNVIYDPYMSIGNIRDIMNCNVITVHASYSKRGEFPSHDLINSNFLKRANTKIIINSARGEIVNENDILENRITYLSDVYKNEQSPNPRLISSCLIATPHIAGYSIEAKHKGTLMILKEFCSVFDLENTLRNLSNKLEIQNPQSMDNDFLTNQYPIEFFNNLIDLEKISFEFKESFLKKGISFSNVRNNYELKNDFTGIKRSTKTDNLRLFINLYKNI